MNSRGIELVDVAPYITKNERLRELANESHLPPHAVKRVVDQLVKDKKNHRRQPKPPAPEGGIGIGAASRKYGILAPTISRWVKKGLIPVLLPTRNEKYINEKKLAELALIYQKNPGQGKLTIKRHLSN